MEERVVFLLLPCSICKSVPQIKDHIQDDVVRAVHIDCPGCYIHGPFKHIDEHGYDRALELCAQEWNERNAKLPEYPLFFRLDEHKNVIPTSAEEMSKFRSTLENKQVRFTEIKKYNVEISTVFLGTDYGFSVRGGHTPVVFETMVFWTEDQELDQYQQRYCLWSQALEGHREIVRMVIRDIRDQLKENPNKVFPRQKTHEEKLSELFASIEKLAEVEAVKGTPEYEFIVSSLKNLERYKKSKEAKNEIVQES